jgi:hypothetical protein
MHVPQYADKCLVAKQVSVCMPMDTRLKMVCKYACSLLRQEVLRSRLRASGPLPRGSKHLVPGPANHCSQ